MDYNSWPAISERVIRRALTEAREQKLNPEETLKHVDAAYPFGERKYWPYKKWLHVRRQLCAGLPGVKPLPAKTRYYRGAEAVDIRGGFFDE